MKNLIYKELKLGIHPTVYLFLLFAAMLLIPQYPYYVAFMYTCLAMFFTFMLGRENRDIFYTALLPVRKRDVVKARILVLFIFQLAQVLLSIPVAVLSVKINPIGGNGAGIDANPALFGLVMGMLGGFNIIFLPAFYKTAHKLGRPMLFGGAFILIYIIMAESLAQYVPSPLAEFLDSTDPAVMARQLPIVVVGALAWVGLTGLAYVLSARRFERVDL